MPEGKWTDFLSALTASEEQAMWASSNPFTYAEAGDSGALVRVAKFFGSDAAESTEGPEGQGVCVLVAKTNKPIGVSACVPIYPHLELIRGQLRLHGFQPG